MRVDPLRDLLALVAATSGTGARSPMRKPMATTSRAPPRAVEHGSEAVASIGKDNGQCRAEDWRHQRGDDHCSDDGGRRVRPDPGLTGLAAATARSNESLVRVPRRGITPRGWPRRIERVRTQARPSGSSLHRDGVEPVAGVEAEGGERRPGGRRGDRLLRRTRCREIPQRPDTGMALAGGQAPVRLEERDDGAARDADVGVAGCRLREGR